MYTSRYKLGQEVFLEEPFSDKVKAEIVGIRFSDSVVTYDISVNGYIMDNISSSIIDGLSESINEYKDYFMVGSKVYFIMDDIVIRDCEVLGAYFYINNNDELDCRYDIGYLKTRNVLKCINPKLIFSKEEGESIYRSIKFGSLI